MQDFQQWRQENPLIKFSLYTQVQVEILRALGKEILDLLDSSMQPGTVDGPEFHRVYGLFWLWVLGSYEVTRTMCQAKSCFSEELAGRLSPLKKRLSQLRMPFAKQEYEGRGQKIKAEASVYNVDTDRKDLSFEVKGTLISVRELLGEFETIFSSIRDSDVLCDLRSQKADRHRSIHSSRGRHAV